MSDELANLIKDVCETAILESVSLWELKLALHDSYIELNEDADDADDDPEEAA